VRLSAPRGTRDIKEREALAFRELESTALDAFRRYGYEEIRTPVFESDELFHRAVGETTDIVEKEMFNFEDRGGRKLALRPEGTAGVVRAYLEHSYDKTGGIKKLFYIGPMFRAERPQAGRYREFWQLGAEFFGNPSPQADADTILLIQDILASFGLGNAAFIINSIGDAACRPKYRDALLDFLRGIKSQLCEDCQRRMEKNPLRCLDCKVDGSMLAGGAPVMPDFLCDPCKTHRDALYSLLDSVGFQQGKNYFQDARLVRGLDYYTRTVFEIKAPGAGEAGVAGVLGAGGRYDGLVKQMGGPDVPAIGFALGIDRTCRAKYSDGAISHKTDGRRIFVALAGRGTGVKGFGLLRELRGLGYEAEIGAEDRSLKSQLRWAESWYANFVVIVGEEELRRGAVLLKNMYAEPGQEKQAEVSEKDLLAKIQALLPLASQAIPGRKIASIRGLPGTPGNAL
jgi:histidyl-tRNA synthetase